MPNSLAVRERLPWLRCRAWLMISLTICSLPFLLCSLSFLLRPLLFQLILRQDKRLVYFVCC